MLKKYRAIKVIAVIFLAGGIIFFRTSPPVRWMQSKAIGTLQPVMKSMTVVGRWMGNITRGGNDTLDQLRAENERLLVESFDREKMSAEIQSLENALAFKSLTRVPLTGARVLLYGSDLGYESLLIDQGMNSGVRKGDVVVDEHGVLVGTVSDSGDDFSRVAIASNPGVTFPIMLSQDGTTALARGMGARTFSLELIPRTSLIRRGDLVARTISGQSAADRAILVGTVMEETPAPSGVFRNAHAMLLVRPEALDDVFVIPGSSVSKTSP